MGGGCEQPVHQAPGHAHQDVLSLATMVDDLGSLLTDLDPDTMASDVAVAAIEHLGVLRRLIDAATTLVARTLPADGWTHRPERTPERWLATQLGCSLAEAHQLRACSAVLAELPAVDRAVRAGRLSGDQVRAIVPAAIADPAATTLLVALAEGESLHGLRAACDQVQAAALGDDTARNERARAQRRLRCRTTREGQVVLDGQGPVTDGVTILEALRAHHQDLFDQTAGETDHPSYEALSWDALVAMAQASLDARGSATDLAPDPEPELGSAPGGEHGDQPHRDTDCTTPGTEQLSDRDAGTRRDAGAAALPHRPARPATRAVRLGAATKILIRCDHSALMRGYTLAGETCEIAGLGPIPVAAVREIMALGDPFLAAVVTRGQDVASVTHLGRRPNAHQLTALEWIHPRCAVTGCDQTILDWDHRIDWSHTHHTRLDELDGLCRPHHRLKTSHGWALLPGQGRRRFVPPDHPDHPCQSDPALRAGPGDRAGPTGQSTHRSAAMST